MTFLEFLRFAIMRNFCDVVRFLKLYRATDSGDLY